MKAIKAPTGQDIELTSLESTLIDITVRSAYSGGVLRAGRAVCVRCGSRLVDSGPGLGRQPGPVTEQTTPGYAAVFDSSMLGTLLSMKHELRVMMPQGSGSIIIHETLALSPSSASQAGYHLYVDPKTGKAVKFGE